MNSTRNIGGKNEKLEKLEVEQLEKSPKWVFEK